MIFYVAAAVAVAAACVAVAAVVAARVAVAAACVAVAVAAVAVAAVALAIKKKRFKNTNKKNAFREEAKLSLPLNSARSNLLPPETRFCLFVFSKRFFL